MIHEGGLRAPERKPLNLESKVFWDEKELDNELRRQFDVCHSCRRCFNLCDSFPKLFDLIDEAETMELDSVNSKNFEKVIDACTLCDMCFMVSCPYVPPHEFAIDIPSLFIRYKAQNKNKVGIIESQLSKTDLNGKIGFWISNPATVDGIIIYLHGLEQNKEEMFAVMDTFASKNIVTVAIDIWGHGERTYLDANGNGSLDSNDSLIITTRYDNPSLTAGYIIQTQFDLLRLRTLLEANLNIRTAIVGSVSEMPPIYFVGHSLGSFVGSNFANTGFPIDGAVISSSGGDISDIGLNGNYRDDILGLIALGLGIDTTTKTGKELLIRKLNGYISYVKGDNPLTFPYKFENESSTYTYLISCQEKQEAISSRQFVLKLLY